ncbi:MAG: DUF5685 family protein [Oscillospiraceae bacterium]
MFGYIRPFKPYLRMYEYDIYKGLYCGLCKTIGSNFGLAPRFALSYDFVFLTLMNLSLNNVKTCGQRERCIAHPLTKSFCVGCNQGLEYSSYAAVLLTYHKLKDDLYDKDKGHSFISSMLLPFYKKPYKKAKAKYKELSETIETQMEYQRKIESEKCAKIDLACEPTAKIMEAIAGELVDDDRKSDMQRFGYLLGRFIYLCDALDDVKRDYKKGHYNPLLLIFDSNNKRKSIDDELFNKIKEYVHDSVYFTLGELANVYVKLNTEMYKPIIDNIVYLGLKNVFQLVEDGKFNRRNERKNRNE